MQAHRAPHSLLSAARVTFALAGGLLLFPAVANAQRGYEMKPVPSGLTAVFKNEPNEPLDPKPFLSPYVSGVAMQIHWSDIEPVRGQPNWARLDHFFAAAQASRKFVHLYVFPGFWSPAWALEGAETDLFAVQYGPGKGEILTLPMPWDPVYLGNWFTFVKQLSERYGDRPEFPMVGAAGPTSVTVEVTEPDNLKATPKLPSPIDTWIKHGYTSTKYIHAWQKAFNTYGMLFPNQYVSLSHGDGVRINAEGVFDPSEQERTPVEIIGEGISTLGTQFVLQSSSLRGNNHQAKTHALIISYNGRCVTGFQLTTSCEQSPASMGAPGNPPLALKRSIENGTKKNQNGKYVDYIEIYTPDVEAEDLQPVLEWGAALLAQLHSPAG
jgi:hypothetical protein